MALYRIAWRMRNKEVGGHGEYCLSLETAEAWLKELKKYADMEHWIESRE
jgi:hypothetical protein